MIRFVIYEAGERVGSINNETGNIQDALLDFWNTFLKKDGNYRKLHIIGNMMQTTFKDTQFRTFIARPEQ